MKQYINKLVVCCLALLVLSGCSKDEYTFGDLTAPNGLQVTADIVGQDGANPDGDGSGLVNFKAVANSAMSYKYIFSDGSELNAPSGQLQKRFTKNGTNTYEVTVVASGRGGVKSSLTFEVQVFSNFSDPEALQMLTGGSTKTWYWAAAEQGHLGVGQNDGNTDLNFYANYYMAAPFEKAGAASSACIYEAKLKFTLVGEQLQFEQDNGGSTFFNTAFESVVGGSAGTDTCYPYNTAGVKNVQLGPSSSLVADANKRGTEMTFSDGGFMGYYIGQSTYEILSITENRLYVRAVMGGNPALAWYHIFTTSPPVQNVDEDYTDLVWSDEFDAAGAPDPTKWGYDLGTNNGWGNNELQNYTNASDNVAVSGGTLKITAKRVGAGFTSARIKTQYKFEFTYGKIEFRAKLPSGGGTWPALWMLGANFDQVGWPASGEIDVMEHVGNHQNVVSGTFHYPGHSGGNGPTASVTVPGVADDFHIYSCVWSPLSIKIYADDTLIQSLPNNATLPFNADFFLIMNIAMGGNLGGTVDPAFTQSTLEVDYVRVYQ